MMLIKTRLYSPSDYLAWEEKATERSEFIDGEIRLMAGGTTKGHLEKSKDLIKNRVAEDKKALS